MKRVAILKSLSPKSTKFMGLLKTIALKSLSFSQRLLKRSQTQFQSINNVPTPFYLNQQNREIEQHFHSYHEKVEEHKTYQQSPKTTNASHTTINNILKELGQLKVRELVSTKQNFSTLLKLLSKSVHHLETHTQQKLLLERFYYQNIKHEPQAKRENREASIIFHTEVDHSEQNKILQQRIQEIKMARINTKNIHQKSTQEVLSFYHYSLNKAYDYPHKTTYQTTRYPQNTSQEQHFKFHRHGGYHVLNQHQKRIESSKNIVLEEMSMHLSPINQNLSSIQQHPHKTETSYTKHYEYPVELNHKIQKIQEEQKAQESPLKEYPNLGELQPIQKSLLKQEEHSETSLKLITKIEEKFLEKVTHQIMRKIESKWNREFMRRGGSYA